MKYIRLNTTDPYYNLALEEYLFRNTDDDVFMLWQNAPSVIIGKNQNAYAEVDLAAARADGVLVCRRITGGGAVYHDLGNVNYTFISVGGNKKTLDFEGFTRPIIDALRGLGAETRLSGRNDIECGGAKISGNAQHSAEGRVLHHGTLLFDTDFSAMDKYLKIDKEKLAYRAVKSYSARVGNLKSILKSELTAEDFIKKIEESVCSELSAVQTPAPECDEINSLYQRNKSEGWICTEKRYLTSYNVIRKKKYPFGLVSVEMELDRGKINKIAISGDFFGTAPIEELEAKLIGKSPDLRLEVDPSPYIHGMTEDALSELLS